MRQFQLFPVRFALVFALLTLLFGFLLGGAFGGAEAQLKAGLKVKGMVVFETVYNADQIQLEQVLSKSWTYYKRAHMHANGIGVVTLVLALLFAALPVKGLLQSGPPLLFALGALGYSVFWLLAGYTAPTYGGTALSKEAFAWLAIPSVILMFFGLFIALLLTIKYLFFGQPQK